MKVAYILPQYLPSTSGDVRDIHQIAKRMVKIGNKATVFTTDAGSEDAVISNKGIIIKDDEIIDGVKIKRYPIQTRFLSSLKFLVDKDRFLKNSKEVDDFIDKFKETYNKTFQISDLTSIRLPISTKLYKSLLAAKNYDILHVNGVPLSHASYAYKASKKNKIPLIIRPAFHASDKFYYNKMNFKIIDHADFIIANTEAELKIFKELDINPDKIRVIGCGIDLKKYLKKEPEKILEIKNEYKFHEYQLNILFLSRLQQEKGLFSIIESVKRLNNRNIKVQLIIAGSDYNKNSDLIKEIAIKCSYISYVGRVSEKLKISLLNACDLLVVPSITDSFGIIYLEAWACKKPVIGADIPSTNSLIAYGQDGYYIKYDDIDELIKKLEYLIENSDKRISMGMNGYKKVKTHYTDVVVFNKILNLYDKILSC